MSGPELAPVLKAIGTAASRPGVSWLKKKTIPLRVARATSKEMRKHGIAVPVRPLRRWLTSAIQSGYLNNPTEAWAAEASRELEWMLPGRDAAARSSAAQAVLEDLLINYLARLDPAAGIAQSHRWAKTAITEDGDRTRRDLDVLNSSVVRLHSASTQFPEHLRSLPPRSAEGAVALKPDWPGIQVVVAELCSSPDRTQTLFDWAAGNPTWIADAPPRGLAWLGSLASAYDAKDAAEKWMTAAVEAGVTPYDYWVARTAFQMAVNSHEAAASALLAERPVDHPLARLTQAAIADDHNRLKASLAAWEPSSDEDRALHRLLEARVAVSEGHLSLAITLAEEAWDTFRTPAGAILAAELLQTRASRHATGGRFADLERSLSLALLARNERRMWAGDSQEAVVAAVSASCVLGDVDRAWALTQQAPEGEATDAEACDPRVIAEACLAAVLSGRTDQAKSLLPQVVSPFKRYQATALLASHEDRVDDCRNAWTSAFDAASDDSERLRAAMGMARTGVLPELDALQDVYPEAVEDVRTVANLIAHSDDPTYLRSQASVNEIGTVLLSEAYEKQGDLAMAGRAFVEGGMRWNDPTLLIMGARKYQSAGALDEATDAIDSALRISTTWPGVERAYMLQVEVESARGRWDLASAAARQLVRLNPQDPDATWALVMCLVERGETADAWRALTTSGTPVAPRTRREAYEIVRLGVEHSTDERFMAYALGLMRQWPADEELLGVILARLHRHVANRADDLSPDDAAALRAAVDDYVTRFPNSKTFRMIEIADDQNPLEAMAQHVPRTPQEVRDLEAEARAGRLPVGLLAAVYGRTYTELSARRGAGLVFAVAPDDEASEKQALLAAGASQTILDIAAAHTIVLLRNRAHIDLLGELPSLRATDQQFVDATVGAQTLGQRSTGSVGWDPTQQRVIPTFITDEEAEGLALLSEGIRALLETMLRMPAPSVPALEPYPLPSEAWASALSLASSTGSVLWTDDLVLRAIAREVGVPTFGTWTVLNAMHDSGRLADDLLHVAQAVLVQQYFVDLPFSERVWTLAAATDGFRPRGAAAALTRVAAWASADAVVDFGLSMAARGAASSPEDVRGWVACMAIGLVAFGGDPENAERNLQVLLRRVLSSPWHSASVLPFVLEGVRAALDGPFRVEDPFSDVLRATYSDLTSAHGSAVAAQLLLGLVAFAGPDDQTLAARVILTS